MSSPGEPVSGSFADETVRVLTPAQRVFQRYLLRKMLGRGGMGVVWLAHDEKLQRDVALKFLPDIVRMDASAFDLLKREARKNLEVTHPHIVRIYDFVDDDTSAAISMEYIDGITLSKLRVDREKKFFEPDELTVWISQLCAALDYAHNEAKLIHRDLKPSNLMVNSKGRLKITDFGIARSVSDSISRVTADRSTAGTLAYMSPQQLRGEKASAVDDIYSVGVTIYELLTSLPPFHSGDIGQQVENKRPPRMSERRKELGLDGEAIPEAWEETVAACLSKDPWSRPQSTVEVVQRLGLPALSTGHVVVSGASIGSRWRRARSWEMLAGVCFLVALVAGLSWYFNKDSMNQASNATPSARPAEKRPAANKAAPTKAGPSDEVFDDLATPRVVPNVFGNLAPGQSWENSLGMRFVPVGKVGLSVWETRVQDFAAFVDATGHTTTTNIWSFGLEGWKRATNSWKEPGQLQSQLHPVCCVSWEDAMTFCRWLTETERKAGRLSNFQRYRLPYAAEWSQAAGESLFPWGEDWPPPNRAANLAGSEVRDGGWPKNREIIDGYEDQVSRTAPVGSFTANSLGIHDLAGNVWEWCMDWSDSSRLRRVFCGGAWDTTSSDLLKIGYQEPKEPNRGNQTIGFRCVLEEIVAP
ncbi:MAG: bifunctional serine/threonine-protein kinase/formylglycine-generating enzyme family protein [Verrucomicrobiota bacterium]